MNPYEFAALAVVTLSVAGVVIADRILGTIRRMREHQLMANQQREQELQLRIAELERHNDERRQQLEWNKRLLEAQDRVLQHLGPGGSERELPTAPSSATGPSRR